MPAPGSIRLIPRANCSLHEGERAEFVNNLLAKGFSATKISSLGRRMGYRIAADTISAHRLVCLGRGSDAEVQASKADLAIMVRDQVAKELDTPRNQVRDGLHGPATARPPRRKSAATGEFMVNLARLLSGGGGLAPVELVEGDVSRRHARGNPAAGPARAARTR